MSKPDLPKRLAARIRAAQERVRSKRLSITSAKANLAGDQRRLAEYEADPAAFARKHYGNNPVDSYPVQTTILRCREDIARRTRRLPEYRVELEQELSVLAQVEAEVLAEVQAMRPSAGRVPWPVLESFKDHQENFEAEQRRIERVIADEDAERVRLEAEELRKMEERHRLMDEDALREVRERRAQMTTEELAREDASTERLKKALGSGEVSVIDLIEQMRAQARQKK